jgi:hypothetical protein
LTLVRCLYEQVSRAGWHGCTSRRHHRCQNHVPGPVISSRCLPHSASPAHGVRRQNRSSSNSGEPSYTPRADVRSSGTRGALRAPRRLEAQQRRPRACPVVGHARPGYCRCPPRHRITGPSTGGCAPGPVPGCLGPCARSACSRVPPVPRRGRVHRRCGGNGGRPTERRPCAAGRSTGSGSTTPSSGCTPTHRVHSKTASRRHTAIGAIPISPCRSGPGSSAA